MLVGYYLAIRLIIKKIMRVTTKSNEHGMEVKTNKRLNLISFELAFELRQDVEELLNLVITSKTVRHYQ